MRELNEFVYSTLQPSSIFPDESRLHDEDEELLERLKKQTSFAYFDFVEVEDVFKKDNNIARGVINNLRALSTSMNQANISEAFHYMLNSMLGGHEKSR